MLVFSTPQPVPIATPTPTPSPMLTVLHLTGTGDLTSPTFTTGPDWTVSYTLDCPTGGTLRVVEIGGQLGGIAIADNAPSTTDIHDAPGTHQLRIESGCAWTLTVTNGDTMPHAGPVTPTKWGIA
ncbi:hypothetical protein [Actinocrinis sp.]|uniref:hypothetical protein n=1 Tax=Actinocrinis sp. TaxID=1920516 RepID=UPI002DDD205C|nr:hypothetical protein [Actinocrinis sp.]